MNHISSKVAVILNEMLSPTYQLKRRFDTSVRYWARSAARIVACRCTLASHRYGSLIYILRIETWIGQSSVDRFVAAGKQSSSADSPSYAPKRPALRVLYLHFSLFSASNSSIMLPRLRHRQPCVCFRLHPTDTQRQHSIAHHVAPRLDSFHASPIQAQAPS